MRRRDDKTYLTKEDKNIFPGGTYREVILEPYYNDSRDQLLEGMMQIHFAHGLMLAEEGIVGKEEMAQILLAIHEINDGSEWKYDSRYEDLFFQVEAELENRVGEHLAGQLHTGRSRNDMDATLYRMVLREKYLILADQLVDFRRVLLKLASEHIKTVMLGYTHTQPAQPTTLAHYLLAGVDFLVRDFQRLREYYRRLNQSPMGAGALTTTSFPINRESVARYLGFAGCIENSYDCVGSSDYLAEAAAVLGVMMTSLTRLIYDCLLYTMAEFDAFRLSDAYVQVSSIMPQKRNPVSLEHSRALANAILGETQVVHGMLSNTPFGDIVDKEQELQRHLWAGLDRAVQLYRLLTVVFAGLEVNRELLSKRAQTSFAVVTQLAESIVQVTGISFRTAHHLVSQVVKRAMFEGKEVIEIDAHFVNEVSVEIIGQSLQLTESLVREALDAEKFVEMRERMGGPASLVVQEQIAKREIELTADEVWVDKRWKWLQNSEELLRTRVEELLAEKLLGLRI